MGILSKITKGFKKIVKGVGRRIKKVAKKIGKVFAKIAKPFQKLGIVGQLALGFIMPWAIGSTFSYLTGNAFTSTIAGLTGPGANIFQKAVGYTFKGIQMGANGIKGAYNTVSGAINGAFDYVGEKVGDFGNWLKGNVEKDPMQITKYSDAAAQAELDKFGITDIDQDYLKEAAKTDVKGVISEAAKKDVKDKTFFETTKEALTELPGKLKEEITGAPTKIAEKITSVGLGAIEDTMLGRDENEYGYSTPYVADFSKIGEASVVEQAEQTYNAGGFYYNTPAAIMQGTQTTYRGDEWNQWFTSSLGGPNG